MTALLSISDINTTVNHVPRIHDLRLAELLGFENVYNIRRLISNHRKTLEKFGELVFSAAEKTLKNVVRPTVGQTSKGGRPGKEYWLNEEQALFLCAKSETPNAIQITIEMVRVFYAVKSGNTVVVREHTRRRPQRPAITPEQFAASIPQQDLFTTGLGHLSQAAERDPGNRRLQTAVACLERFEAALNKPVSLNLLHHVVAQGEV